MASSLAAHLFHVLLILLSRHGLISLVVQNPKRQYLDSNQTPLVFQALSHGLGYDFDVGGKVFP